MARSISGGNGKSRSGPVSGLAHAGRLICPRRLVGGAGSHLRGPRCRLRLRGCGSAVEIIGVQLGSTSSRSALRRHRQHMAPEKHLFQPMGITVATSTRHYRTSATAALLGAGEGTDGRKLKPPPPMRLDIAQCLGSTHADRRLCNSLFAGPAHNFAERVCRNLAGVTFLRYPGTPPLCRCIRITQQQAAVTTRVCGIARVTCRAMLHTLVDRHRWRFRI